MSKLRIKLKVPSSDDAPGATAATTEPLAASQPQSMQMLPGDLDPFEAGDGDISMATSNAADSEDELASGDDDDDGSNDPSSSAAEGSGGHRNRERFGEPSSRTASPGTSSSKGRRRATIKDEVGHLTAEELDALPPAKRRKGAKARGAPGPGRGWRKGLKMGQKPVYALPDATPVAEGTPSTLASDFNRASPASALSLSPKRASSVAMAPSLSGTKTKAGVNASGSASGAPGSSPQSLGQRQQLAPGRASQAVAAAMNFGPPVKQPPKLINAWNPPSTASGTAAEAVSATYGQRPRRWYQDERQIVNLAGRVIKIKTWWGGKNESFDPIVDRAREESLKAQATSDAAKGRTAQETDDPITGSPSASRLSAQRSSATSVLQAATAALAATNNSAPSRNGLQAATKGTAAAAAQANGGFFTPSAAHKGASRSSAEQQGTPTPSSLSPSSHSHLPKPKFQPGIASIADWRASSVGRSASSSKK